MAVTFQTITRLARTAFNAAAPSRFYRPNFNIGDTLVPQGVEAGTPVDLPRFAGDTLIHVLGGFSVKIAALSYGEYSSSGPQAEFRHTRLGRPHYEVEVLEDGGAFSSYGRTPLPVKSKIHVDAQIFDGRFEALPKSQAAAA